jgi:broad specificity phosphatase PhoE
VYCISIQTGQAHATIKPVYAVRWPVSFTRPGSWPWLRDRPLALYKAQKMGLEGLFSPHHRAKGRMPTTLTLIRHGEVENPHQVYYGRLPGFGLSQKGRRQALAAAQLLRDARPAALFSSPLPRARQTAKILLESIPAPATPRIQISALLLEVYSPFDGQPRAHLESRQWDIYTGSQPHYEQPADVLKRLLKFTARVQQRYPGQHIIAVTHGDPIEFFTLWALGLPVKNNSHAIPYPAPASLSTFVFGNIPGEKPAFQYSAPEVQ